MARASILLSAAVLAGCAQLPPTAADMQAKKFEAVSDKAVVYLVRQPMDSTEFGGLLMDTGEQVTLFPRTYYRWEVAPGAHSILGLGPYNTALQLNAEAGRIYFLRHTVSGTPRTGPQLAALTPISEQEGRRLVQGSELVR